MATKKNASLVPNEFGIVVKRGEAPKQGHRSPYLRAVKEVMEKMDKNTYFDYPQKSVGALQHLMAGFHKTAGERAFISKSISKDTRRCWRVS